ncbi:transposase [Streptomyces sp. NBC_01476]|uniref:transposase n=1 Tax=Streptomyces sp. NBC_01476 TaxID=2903881 RepID=UPI002E330F08|nr:transposase [Streptomyces sp. NBC_01476]
MSKRYTAEFKREAVALFWSSGRNVTEVARELGVIPERLRGPDLQTQIRRRWEVCASVFESLERLGRDSARARLGVAQDRLAA